MPGYIIRFYEVDPKTDEEYEISLSDKELSAVERFVMDELEYDTSITKIK